MNLETPFWKSRASFWLASAILALSIFFANTDFAWRPHQSVPEALFYASFAPLALLSNTAIFLLLGRLFRVPVEWKFLLRLNVWMAILLSPVYLLNAVCEGVFALQQTERAFAIFASGIVMTLWAFQIVQRYKMRANPQVLVIYCAISVLITASFVITPQHVPTSQVMGAHPWKWQTYGRVNLAYTDEIRDEEFARADARNVAEMLRRVEKSLGAGVSTHQINVFLFPTAESLNEFTVIEVDGVAGEAGVLLVGYEWEGMRGTLAHELSHFVVASEFGPNVRSLADEGTAVWIEQKLAPTSEEFEDALVPRQHEELVTWTLAKNRTFYDEDQMRLSEHYEQAGWLAKTTIGKHGLPKWREFLRVCQSNWLDTHFELRSEAGADVTEQYQRIFGEPMP